MNYFLRASNNPQSTIQTGNREHFNKPSEHLARKWGYKTVYGTRKDGNRIKTGEKLTRLVSLYSKWMNMLKRHMYIAAWKRVKWK